jgi:hypothetical protein
MAVINIMGPMGPAGPSGPSIIPSTVVITFNEVTSVPAGVETTVATYTSPASGSTAYLELVSVSGSNIGAFVVYEVSAILDKKRTYFTKYNENFDFRSAIGVPGYELAPSTTIIVKVLHNRPSLGTFSARIQTIEVV